MKKSSVRHLRHPSASLPRSSSLTQLEPYEHKLGRAREWAMSEGSKFFQGTSDTHLTLKKITGKLRELGIDYAVVGGMALFQHGYRRFTEDVDLLVSRDDLKEIHRKLDGLGYVPPFAGSKNLRDTEYGVKIEFLVTGEYPGDGKPKPVAFPSPAAVVHEIDGIRYINLPALVELKLASGITSSERMKDLADILELIKTLNLPVEFADALNPFVREKYKELWEDAHPPAKRYFAIWRNQWLSTDAKSVKDMIEALQTAVGTLQSMLGDGVTLEPERGATDDYAYLVTTDPIVAKKYDMHDEKEFWAGDEKGDLKDKPLDEA